jgi:hypothetical protein
MAILEINIPADKVDRVLAAIKGIYPIPQIEDPENPGEYINEFGDLAWSKKIVIDHLKRTINRYERKIAQDAIVVENIDLS